ncbi:MAG TPA: metallophosphoesterase [Candidatus Acidoferrales bacterium]|jgi:Icc protein|nr:metallophosphoesterase [Candidatus Acidoferrales bacterium]
MKQLRTYIAGLVCGVATSLVAANPDDVTVAQISDTHLGEKHSPQAAANLREVVEMVNARHPDAVIISGDIGENQESREQAKMILKDLAAPVYYVPGNHEFHDTNGLAAYRKQFGPDYYRIQVKNVEVLALDSQLLGNYERFEAKKSPPLSAGMEAESAKMLDWMAAQAAPTKGKVVIAVQHIPLFRDGGFPDGKPYWTVNEPYARREADLLHRLGIKHLLAGHWHNGRVFEQDGITIHVAPATSWLPLGGELGFALHSITGGGVVHTDFVPLTNTVPSPDPRSN